MVGESSAGLRDYTAVLRARWIVVAAVTLIAIGVGVAYSLLAEKQYESSSTIRFRNAANDIGVVTPGAQLPVDVDPSKSAAANSSIVTSDAVIAGVIDSTGTDLNEDDLRDAVTTSVEPDSNLVEIKVSASSAGSSARIANGFADTTKQVAARQARNSLEDQADKLKAALKNGDLDKETRKTYEEAIARLDTLSQVTNPVEVTTRADAPDSASSPKPARDIVLAGLLGLVFGIGGAFLLNAFDRRLADPHELQRRLGLPLVGFVPDDLLGKALPTGDARDADAEQSLEPFRIVRANVQFIDASRDIGSIVVTSPLPEEGKSTVASWVAYVSAAAGRSTLLVDCDLRRPVLADRTGEQKTPGLSDLLVGDATFEQCLHMIDVPGPNSVEALTLVPAGGNLFRPAEMLTSDRFTEFVERAHRNFDFVVFDSAPLLPVGDTRELIPLISAVLVCLRMRKTTQEQAQLAKEVLDRLPAKPTGIVATGLRRGDRDDYYGYYGSRSPLTRAGSAG